MWQEQVQLRRVDQHLLMPIQVPGPLYLFQVFPKEPEKPTLTDITQKGILDTEGYSLKINNRISITLTLRNWSANCI